MLKVCKEVRSAVGQRHGCIHDALDVYNTQSGVLQIEREESDL